MIKGTLFLGVIPANGLMDALELFEKGTGINEEKDQHSLTATMVSMRLNRLDAIKKTELMIWNRDKSVEIFSTIPALNALSAGHGESGQLIFLMSRLCIMDLNAGTRVHRDGLRGKNWRKNRYRKKRQKQLIASME